MEMLAKQDQGLGKDVGRTVSAERLGAPRCQVYRKPSLHVRRWSLEVQISSEPAGKHHDISAEAIVTHLVVHDVGISSPPEHRDGAAPLEVRLVLRVRPTPRQVASPATRTADDQRVMWLF